MQMDNCAVAVAHLKGFAETVTKENGFVFYDNKLREPLTECFQAMRKRKKFASPATKPVFQLATNDLE